MVCSDRMCVCFAINARKKERKIRLRNENALTNFGPSRIKTSVERSCHNERPRICGFRLFSDFLYFFFFSYFCFGWIMVIIFIMNTFYLFMCIVCAIVPSKSLPL